MKQLKEVIGIRPSTSKVFTEEIGRDIFTERAHGEAIGRVRTGVFLLPPEVIKALAGTHEDIEKIAVAAGVNPKKTAKVKIIRGRGAQQQSAMETIEKVVKQIICATDREDAIAQTGIAVGYANAMYHNGLMTKEELQEMIEMLGQVGEDALARVEKSRPSLLSRLTARRGRA